MRLLLCLSFLLFVCSAFGTTYTFIVSFGDWENPVNWDVMPPNTIPVGDMVVIGSSKFVEIKSFNIVNNGTITMTDGSIFQTSGTSTLMNNGTITLDNFSKFTINDMSTVTNNGTITLDNFSVININQMGTFFTCDPEPVLGDPGNFSMIFDLSGGSATLASCPPPSAPIPTLSEWGLILLSMSLSILGIVGIRQRVLA